MQHTSRYKLNLIESGDTFSAQPLNENAEKLEEAIWNVRQDLEQKNSEQTAALNNLSQTHTQEIEALAASGIKVAYGTYTGTGTYGTGEYTSITVTFAPKFLIVWGPYAHIALGVCNSPLSIQCDYSGWDCTTVWSGNTVKWCYSGSSAQQQMNESGKAYCYFAIG